MLYAEFTTTMSIVSLTRYSFGAVN